MGTTLDHITEFLQARDLKFHHDTERDVILTGFGTKNYQDKDGDFHLTIVISLEENGEFIKIFTPKCYACPDETNRAAVMQTLLMVSWKTKMVQFEFDATDGEIRAIIEFPLEDSELTERQLHRAIQALIQIVEKFHPVINKALTEGVIEFEVNENPLEELQTMFSRFESMLEEMGIDMDELEGHKAKDEPSTDADDDDDEWI